MATWATHTDDSGRPYYYNSVTQESTFNAPHEEILPVGWHRYMDDSGRAYYHNAADGTTQYELPIGDDDASSAY